MKKVLILVEGQTEKAFVDKILSQYFCNKNIILIPKIVTTKNVKFGKNFKGGIVSYQKAKNDILKLLKDTSADLVTTMFDYYGLPNDFPEIKNKISISDLEQVFENDINSNKFKAFLVLHEFEGLLFSKPAKIAEVLIAENKTDELQQIRDSFSTPEDINNNPNTAPSKRILKILPDYDKVIDGSIIAGRIGLDIIRKECKHFDEWLVYIENV